MAAAKQIINLSFSEKKIQCTLDVATGLRYGGWGRFRQRGRYLCNTRARSSIGVEVGIGSAAAISKVAISNGHCIVTNLELSLIVWSEIANWYQIFPSLDRPNHRCTLSKVPRWPLVRLWTGWDPTSASSKTIRTSKLRPPLLVTDQTKSPPNILMICISCLPSMAINAPDGCKCFDCKPTLFILLWTCNRCTESVR